MRDLVLDSEDVGHVAIKPLGPQMIAGFRFDQLACNPHALTGSSYASLEDMPHAKFASDLLHIDESPLVDERRSSRDDKEPSVMRKGGNDVFCNAIREILLLGITAHVREREHRNRWLVRKRKLAAQNARGRRTLEPPVH